MSAPKLVILDRDGVINADSDEYIKSVEEWIPLPGSLAAIARLKQAGWTVAVATNQSGIARGLFPESVFHAMHDELQQRLAALGACIDYVAFCPHAPDDACACRKPRPGLYQEIAQHFGCDLRQVPVVGDSRRDLEAAVAVGARPILVTTGKGMRSLRAGPLPLGSQVFVDLSSAVDALLSR